MSPLYGSVIFNMVLKIDAEGERPKSIGCGRFFFFFNKLVYFVLSTHFLIYFLFVSLAVPCGMWDLSSLTRDQTLVCCTGSTEC